jgi:nucleoside-diphosphate kinase
MGKRKMIEQTLVLVKPDGVKRGLTGDIIKRFEQCGLKIVGMKMTQPSKSLVGKHYPASDKQLIGMGSKTLNAAKENGELDNVQKVFKTQDPKEIGTILRQWLIDFLISGPVVSMVIEGNRAISVVRKICGFTCPAKADIGTIRGDFGHTPVGVWNLMGSAIKNLVHASGNKEEADQEIALWFNKEEIHNYKASHDSHVIK